MELSGTNEHTSGDIPTEHDLFDMPIRRLANTFINRSSNELDHKNKFFLTTYLLVRSNFETYKAISKLVKDGYPFQGAILNRSLLDSALTAIIMCSKPEEHAERFVVAGYRDERRQIKELKEKHGNDMGWSKYISGWESSLKGYIKDLKINVDYDADWEMLVKWPSPGVAVQKRTAYFLDDSAFQVYEHRYHLKYPRYSQWSHQDWLGITAGCFAKKPDADWEGGKFESDVLVDSALYMTIILSEIEAVIRMWLAEQLQYEWTILGAGDDYAKDYYAWRYQGLLRDADRV